METRKLAVHSWTLGRAHTRLGLAVVLASLGLVPILGDSAAYADATPSQVLASDNFDAQSPGPLITTTQIPYQAGYLNQQSGSVTVENSVADSQPNALEAPVSSSSGDANWAGEHYGPSYRQHTLNFNLYLGPGFSVPTNGYVTLARLLTNSPGNPLDGKVSLILASGNNLHIDYVDATGNSQTIWPSNATLSSGSWHSMSLSQNAVGANQTITLTVDGQVIANATANTGGYNEQSWELGDVYTSGSGGSGALYLDDVLATSTDEPAQTGAEVEADSFSQSPGPVLTGQPGTNTNPPGPSGAVDPTSRLQVENVVYDVGRDAMEASVTGGGAAYLYANLMAGGSGYPWQPATWTSATLSFPFYIGPDFSMPSSDYMVIGQLENTSTSHGKVSLVLAGNQLHLDYLDGSGTQHFLYTSQQLTPSTWYQIDVTEDVSTGTLTLYIDSAYAATVSGLSLGSPGTNYAALGMEYSPNDPAIAGHLYFGYFNVYG